jgi:hypothetical protein
MSRLERAIEILEAIKEDAMYLIHNSNGDIIQRSKNLAGLRRYASKVAIESVRLSGFTDGTGMLTTYFADGASSTVSFASFYVLQKFVRDWRNARGAAMVVNGLSRGAVTTKEPRNFPACMRRS